MPTPLYIVDAFTSSPFSGNAAGVCLLREAAEGSWMQDVAQEMNLSETAFLYPKTKKAANKYNLRWFTPTMEVDLCGHATLASAHVLWETGAWSGVDEVSFQTRSGELRAVRNMEAIELNFPAGEAMLAPAPPDFSSLLSVNILWVGFTGSDFLLELSSAAAVKDLKPNFSELAKVETRGIIVTALSDDGSRADFVSRFFAPRFGIDEDPVTGSAHCSLGPYWCSKLKKNTLVWRQLSRRGGEVRVVVDRARIRLSGSAVTVLRGELF